MAKYNNEAITVQQMHPQQQQQPTSGNSMVYPPSNVASNDPTSAGQNNVDSNRGSHYTPNGVVSTDVGYPLHHHQQQPISSFHNDPSKKMQIVNGYYHDGIGQHQNEMNHNINIQQPHQPPQQQNVALLDSASAMLANSIGKPMALVAPPTEDSIIELMGRECVRQFFEVLRTNPGLCRVFCDPQASFHYHKVASQADFATDGQFMFSGKDHVIEALRGLDLVDANIDLLLVRSLEIKLSSLLASINKDKADEASLAVVAGLADGKHLLSTSVHGVLQTRSNEYYRIFMTMTTLVMGGHFKILTQSLVMWALSSSAPPMPMPGMVMPAAASAYDYDVAAMFGMQSPHTGNIFHHMPPLQHHPQQQQHLMNHQFQQPSGLVNNVPINSSAVVAAVPHLAVAVAPGGGGDVVTYNNNNDSNASADNNAINKHLPSSDFHRPEDAATAVAEPHNNDSAGSYGPTSSDLTHNFHNKSGNIKVFSNNPSASQTVSTTTNFSSRGPESIEGSSKQQHLSNSSAPSSSSALNSQQEHQQQTLPMGNTPVTPNDVSSEYDSVTPTRERSPSGQQQQQRDPYSNFKQQQQQQHAIQLNNASDEGYSSSLPNADVGNDNLIHQYGGNATLVQKDVSHPQMHVVGPIMHQQQQPYAAVLGPYYASNGALAVQKLATHSAALFSPSQHHQQQQQALQYVALTQNDGINIGIPPMQVALSNGPYEQQQTQAYRQFPSYNTEQSGSYGGGGGGFRGRPGNRGFNFRRGGGGGGFRGGRDGDGGRGGNRNGSRNLADASQRTFYNSANPSSTNNYPDGPQQQHGISSFYAGGGQRGGRSNKFGGGGGSITDTNNNNSGDYRSAQQPQVIAGAAATSGAASARGGSPSNRTSVTSATSSAGGPKSGRP